jgi:four helix bundle protein
MGAKTVQELAVWQLCDELREKVLAATEIGPATGNPKFCNQVRDAAVDAEADVAEGFARFKPNEFAQFLGYALSSLSEVETRTRDGHRRRYLDDATAGEILRLSQRAQSAARSLRRYLWSLRRQPPPQNARPPAPRRRRPRD